MTERTSITKLIQKKVKSFTKEKFIDIFEILLYDYVNSPPIINNMNNNNINYIQQYSFTQKVNVFKNRKLVRDNNIWHSFANYLFKNDEKYNMPFVIISYLNLKISIIIQRIIYVSTKYNYPITFISRKYIDICRYEIQKIKLFRQNNQKHLTKKKICFTKLNENKKGASSEKSRSKSNQKAAFISTTEENNKIINVNTYNFIETQYELEGRKKEDNNNLNLFIGNFNINKFKDHNQTVYLKKYGNIYTFIFVNKEDTNDSETKNNPDHRKVKSKNWGKPQIVSMPKIYGKKGSVNIHRFDSFKFLDNEIQGNNYDTKPLKEKHSNITSYMKNNLLSCNRKSSTKLKKSSIKMPLPMNLTNLTDNNLNHTHSSRNKNINKPDHCYSEEVINKNIAMNLFKKRKCKIKNNCNLKLAKSVLNHNTSRNYNEKSMLLGYDNNSFSKSNSKTRNKIRITNFFSKTDLYY